MYNNITAIESKIKELEDDRDIVKNSNQAPAQKSAALFQITQRINTLKNERHGIKTVLDTDVTAEIVQSNG